MVISRQTAAGSAPSPTRRLCLRRATRSQQAAGHAAPGQASVSSKVPPGTACMRRSGECGKRSAIVLTVPSCGHVSQRLGLARSARISLMQ